MCEAWSDDVRRGAVDLGYYDEQTWKRFNPKLVEMGEKADLEHVQEMGVYEYVSREVGRRDGIGKMARVKCVRVDTRSDEEQRDVRCRVVALYLGVGERFEELFVGVPSLEKEGALLSIVVPKGLSLMALDVKCTSLYSHVRRSVYIELSRQAPRHGGCVMRWES